MRSLLPLFSFAFVIAAVRAQDDDPPPLPEGPALVYVDAFPAQAGFDRPLFVRYDASDEAHAYVVTQPGRIFAVPRDGTVSERRVFFDWSGKVFTDHLEEGLLGFAFDPAFAQNGFVYVYWTEKTEVRAGEMADGKKPKSNRQSVISRFATSASGGARAVDPASELRIMEIFQPYPNHNGGTLEFGPDGMLYIALGDGGAANDPHRNAQSKKVLLGKVLRIDVRGAHKEKPYSIPADNPFVREEGARGEIWCYGMRNPWRITFDRATGDLWCGDVGQNKIEEVDRLVKGGNYGWNAMEGDEVFTLRKGRDVPEGVIAPIATYEHKLGLSVTGGYVYRGAKIAALQGWFVYGDYETLRMWACKEDRAGGKHQVVTLPRAPQRVSSFAQEPDGELLFTGFDGKQGRIWRLTAPAGH
jgi:glucose/arabinose dehydrogenase